MVRQIQAGSRRRKISLKASLEFTGAYGLRQDYVLDSTTDEIPRGMKPVVSKQCRINRIEILLLQLRHPNISGQLRILINNLISTG